MDRDCDCSTFLHPPGVPGCDWFRVQSTITHEQAQFIEDNVPKGMLWVAGMAWIKTRIEEGRK